MYLNKAEVLNPLKKTIQEKKNGQSTVLSDPFISGLI